METKTNNLNSKLIVDNRKFLSLTGILEVLSANESNILIKMQDNNLSINGNNMHIIKLDINNGNIEVEGIIDCVNFSKNHKFFKRLFK